MTNLLQVRLDKFANPIERDGCCVKRRRV